MAIKLVSKKEQYNQEAVDILEELLSRAKNGKLVELVCVYLDDEGYYDHRHTRTENTIQEMGAVARLQHLLQTTQDQLEEEARS